MKKGFKINVLFLKLRLMIVRAVRAVAVNTNAVLGVVTGCFQLAVQGGKV